MRRQETPRTESDNEFQIIGRPRRRTLDHQTAVTMSSHDHLTTIGRRQTLTTAGNVWCTQTVVHQVRQWSLILKTPSDNSRLWAYIGQWTRWGMFSLWRSEWSRRW